MKLNYNCPSCGTKLAGIEPLTNGTTVNRRTCRKCGETWQVVSSLLSDARGIRMDKGEFTFIGRKRRTA